MEYEKPVQTKGLIRTMLNCLSKVLKDHGRHSMLSFLSPLSISVLRTLQTEVNMFYNSMND